MNAENVAEILLEIKAVTLNPSKPYRYASGILSPIYTDNRLLMGYPEQRKKIIGAMAELLEKRKTKFDLVAGTATAGIPHAAWLADKTGKPMVYVRSEEKQHGKQNKIEGLVKKGWKAVVVEDLVSTGGSSVETVRGLREAGIEAEDIVAIFTYNMKAATDKFLAEKISLFALTDFSTLINVAARKKYITEQEKETALEWNKDPQGWGKKMGFE
ncbi:MAG: orotate phosphoribosyltransferase [Candidatus Diapherotrites archaeon]|nr:orotate phosphoribosyltransferase [Candidatus Diapherotrites archaeon]